MCDTSCDVPKQARMRYGGVHNRGRRNTGRSPTTGCLVGYTFL